MPHGFSCCPQTAPVNFLVKSYWLFCHSPVLRHHVASHCSSCIASDNMQVLYFWLHGDTLFPSYSKDCLWVFAFAISFLCFYVGIGETLKTMSTTTFIFGIPITSFFKGNRRKDLVFIYVHTSQIYVNIYTYMCVYICTLNQDILRITVYGERASRKG